MLIVCALASTLVVGCASVTLPQAKKGYEVFAGDKSYYAKSVKIHGDWVEMELPNGTTVWANGVVITPLN